MDPVSIVTIKSKIPLFKGEDLAERVELIELEEVGFEIVSQKDLYKIGDKAVYIQPDYCLPDTILFESFIRPGGDEGKSMLGKINGEPRRIRAKKFNLHKGDNIVVYSNGILLPMMEVYDQLQFIGIAPDKMEENLTENLGITKYEEPEYTSKGGLKTAGAMSFPAGIYKTDEENVNNLWNHIEKKIGYPIDLIGTVKEDGSSTTIGITDAIPEGFICSRNMRKKFFIKKVVGRRKKTFLEYLKFWKRHDLNIYQEMPSDDDFVKNGMPYLNMLKEKGYQNIILRGELNGGSLKGSGNKNNPASKRPVNIKFFGLDKFENGVSVKDTWKNLINLSDEIPIDLVKQVFRGRYNSKEEILIECNNYFKECMIEGIVIRTPDSSFSAKVMNLEYDSEK